MHNVWLLILCGVLAALALGFGFGFWRERRRSRRILERLDQMLECGKNGTFREAAFDETMLSQTETHFAEYLAASEVSAQNLNREKEKIKALISDISHQTKTPIANVLLYTQLLREQPLNEQGAACARALETQAEKLRFLIESLVKTSRLEAGIFELHPAEAAVQPLLEETLDQIAPKAQAKGITVEILPGEAPLTACFDAKWTAEAIYNLADNAVKYTPPGGHVRLSATGYDLFVRLDVADTGIGIAEAEQARVFGRFYRSPAVAKSEGVGLGLYLARRIVTGEGGYCKVESVPGKGSTFSLFLPRNLAKAKDLKAAEKDSRKSSGVECVS